MANSSNTRSSAGSHDQDLNELRKRIDWLDEERRKVARKLAEVEQRGVLQEREVTSRDQRIAELEKQVGQLTSALARIPQVDIQLAQFKDDIVKMIEQYDRRRIESEKELDRLRRVEHESTTREIADIRKQLPAITRLEQDLLLRQAEDGRLANLIGVQTSAASQVRTQVESIERSIAFLEERERLNNRNITEAQAALLEISKRWEPINNRLEILNDNLLKVQSAIQAVNEAQHGLRDSTKDWTEQVQIGEHERNQRLAAWQRAMDEHESTLQRFTQEWVKFNTQFNDSKTALETLKSLRTHLEQQQREAMELVRVESQRMETRWEQFSQEDAKKWKNFESDFIQRQSIVDRRERQFQEQLHVLEDAIGRLQQDRDQILRLHAAQSEAIKKWPLLWMDELEKAADQNPNRRRQPALTPVREE
jgi:chromosome segregation ATPase